MLRLHEQLQCLYISSLCPQDIVLYYVATLLIYYLLYTAYHIVPVHGTNLSRLPQYIHSASTTRVMLHIYLVPHGVISSTKNKTKTKMIFFPGLDFSIMRILLFSVRKAGIFIIYFSVRYASIMWPTVCLNAEGAKMSQG